MSINMSSCDCIYKEMVKLNCSGSHITRKWLIDSLRNKLYLEGKYPFSWYESVIACIPLLSSIISSCIHTTLFPLKMFLVLQGRKIGSKFTS